MAFALTTLGGKILHQILVSIADKVVIGCTILTEVEILVLEYCNKIAECIDLVFTLAEFCIIFKVCNENTFEAIGFGKCLYLFVYLLANVRITFEGDKVLKITIFWNVNIKALIATTLITDILNEENYQYIIFVLACIHAATKFIAAFP